MSRSMSVTEMYGVTPETVSDDVVYDVISASLECESADLDDVTGSGMELSLGVEI